MRRAAIDDQEYRVRGSNHQTFEKLNEDIGVDAAFFLDHEAHVTARSDRRDQASVTGLGLSIPFASSSRRIVLLSGVGAWPPPDGV